MGKKYLIYIHDERFEKEPKKSQLINDLLERHYQGKTSERVDETRNSVKYIDIAAELEKQQPKREWREVGGMFKPNTPTAPPPEEELTPERAEFLESVFQEYTDRGFQFNADYSKFLAPREQQWKDSTILG